MEVLDKANNHTIHSIQYDIQNSNNEDYIQSIHDSVHDSIVPGQFYEPHGNNIENNDDNKPFESNPMNGFSINHIDASK